MMETGEPRRRSSLAQINVTPLVDVMLVLLIIFMVTAPMLEQGFDVDLPETTAGENLPQQKEPLVVSVDRNGRVSVGDSKVREVAKLRAVLEEIVKNREIEAALIEADRSVPYGRVIEVMAAIQQAGIYKVGMVTQIPEESGAAR